MKSSRPFVASSHVQRTTFPPFLVSGGQTGADRAGLDYAIAQGLSHAGYCRAGRRVEDGRLADSYNLIETKSNDEIERTRKNVRLAHATVIFTARPLAIPQSLPRRSGTAMTVYECKRQGRPFLVLAHFPQIAADAAELKDFLITHAPRVLNIAGSSENKTPGIYAHVLAVLTSVATDLTNRGKSTR